MRIKYTRNAVKVVDSLDKSLRGRIKDAIEGLNEEPPRGDIKQLQNVESPVYRLRIGKYRIIFEYKVINNEKIILIKDIGSRGDIYK